MTEKPGNKSRRRPSIETNSLDVLLGFHTRLAMTEIRRSYFRHVGNGEVRPGLASLLQLVAANPGASQIEISRAMHIDKASLVSLLDKAETAGWLNRERSKKDRRRHELVVTAAGKKMAAKLRRQMLRHEEKFLNRFSASELEQLVAYLRRIYE